MAETYSAGVVTAYGAAVRGGYTGTYEEFCAEQAGFAENAAAVAQAKADVETMQGQVEQTAATFVDTTVPAAVTTVQEAGAAQVQAVQSEGTMQAAAVETVGTQQKAAVEAAGSDAVDAVEAAETAATDAVTAAQTAAVQAVQAESATQQAAVQAKGAETIASIPSDYTELSGEVDDLKSAFDSVTATDSYYDTSNNLISEYLQTGYYNDSGVYTTAPNFSYTRIDVEGVRKVKISGTHHVYTIAQFGAFGVVMDANGALINDIKDIYGGVPTEEPYELELPANAKYIYLNTDYNASYYPDSFPAGLYCYPQVESLMLLTDKLNVQPVKWTDISDGKKIKIIAGVIRNSGNGWEFINDAGHEPLNLSSVSVNGSGQIVLDYGFTATKVLSLVVCPDETFAGLYSAGASVGASQSLINVYELPTNIGGMVQFSNGAWDLSKSNYTNASFNDNTGVLTLTHKDLRNFPDSDIHRVTASSNSGICSITSIGYDATQIALRNYTGEVITSLPNNARFFISQPLNTRYVNASYVVNASGNFWIYGVMETE